MAVTNPFRHIHVLYECLCTHEDLKVRKMHTYGNWPNRTWIFCSSSSSSVELAYHQSGTSNLDGFYTKRLPSVAYMTLDQENLRNFTQNCKLNFVGRHFLYMHVHSTFHRKVGAGVEGDGARANTSK